MRQQGIRVLLLFTGLDLLGVAFDAYITAQGTGVMLTFLLSTLLCLTTLVIWIAWFFALKGVDEFDVPWTKYRLPLLWIFMPVVLGAVVAMPFTYWPMHLAFAFQRTQLEQLARRVERGDAPKKPVFLGFYVVTLAERNSQGTVCLWICPSGGRCIGFGKCKRADVSRNFFNLNVHVPLADNWHFVEED